MTDILNNIPTENDILEKTGRGIRANMKKYPELANYETWKDDIYDTLDFITNLPHDIKLADVRISALPRELNMEECVDIVLDYYNIDQKQLEKEKLQVLEELNK